MLNFVNAGYNVCEHTDNPKKKSTFTTELTNSDKPKPQLEIDTKRAAVMMQTANSAEIFGNSPININTKRSE